MIKISYILFICFCIFLISCTSGGKEGQTTEGRENKQKAAENKSEAEEEEGQYPKVVDGTGVSHQLKLGEVDVKAVEYEFGSLFFASDYSQVVDGHYYYLRTDGSGNYTVYRDQGEKVVRFTIDEDSYIENFVKYGGEFYAFVKANESIGYSALDNALVSIDAKTGKMAVVKNMTVETGDYRLRAILHKDSLYYEDYSNYYREDEDYVEAGAGRMAEISLNKNLEKKFLSLTSRMESMKEELVLTFMDGKIYYGEQQGKKVRLFSYDLGSGEEKEIFCYDRADPESVYIEIKIDNEYIYCQDYMIPRKGGKMEQMSKNAGSLNFSPDGKYMFYLDEKSRIHRISRKSHKDIVICDDIQTEELDCTEEGIYVMEHNKTQDKRDDDEHWNDWADPRSNNLYFMDFDGKNRKKIWKEVTETNGEYFG